MSLEKYVKSYKLFIDTNIAKIHLKLREKKKRLHSEVFSKEFLSRADVAEFERKFRQVFSEFWSLGWWANREVPINRIFQKNRVDKIREELYRLLYGEEELGKRIDEFRRNIEGLGMSTISEILCFTFPNKYPLLNRRSVSALKKLDLADKFDVKALRVSDLNSLRGGDYVDFSEFMFELKGRFEELFGKGVDFADFDYFLYFIDNIYREEGFQEQNNYWVEVSAPPWPGHTGIILWAPKGGQWRRMEEIRVGDVVIHYRTSRAKKWQKSFVGYSRVKFYAVVISREELFEILRELDVLDDEYKDFAKQWTENHGKFYLIELEDFKEFERKVRPQDAGIEIQQSYVFRLDTKKGEYLISLGSGSNHEPGFVVEWSLDALRGAVNRHKLVFNDDVLSNVVSALKAGKNVILVGPPGTGKTRLALLVAEAHGLESVVVTATGEWSRVDVIGGPVFVGGQVRWKSGCLLEAVARWYSRNRRGALLVIDEINRANMDRALGEFFTIFGSSNPSEWEISASILEEISMYGENCDEWGHVLVKAWKDERNRGRGGGLKIPEGFRVIATMNTMDRRYLFSLGYALLRRFAVVEVLNPPEDALRKLLEDLLEEYNHGDAIVDRVLKIYSGLYGEIELPVGVALLMDCARIAGELVGSGFDVDDAVSRAFVSTVLVQFEGLSLDKLKKIRGFFRSGGYSKILEVFDRFFPEVGRGNE